jgi:hypothetical protein
MSHWTAWFDRLTQQGKAKAGQPLAHEGKIVSGKQGRTVVDGDPFIDFVNNSGDGPQLSHQHFGDERQRLNDRRIFSDWQRSGEFFEPRFDPEPPKRAADVSSVGIMPSASTPGSRSGRVEPRMYRL